MKTKLFKLFLICLVIASCVTLARLYYYLTDDFRLANISYEELKDDVRWETPRLSAEQEQSVLSILQQPFYYIGKGAQCYAFESQDGRYVLKFFKFKHLKPFWLHAWLPDVGPLASYKKKSAERKQRKLDSVFSGYAIAYRENLEGSHLVFLHLKPTDYLHQFATVFDKAGFKHTIDLDKVVFLLQHKGETLRSRLVDQLDRGDIQEAKDSISKILAMYVSEYQKGLYDHDHGVLQNTGFVGSEPFHLDVGKFKQDSLASHLDWYKKDLEHVAWKVDTWIKKHYPISYQELSLHIADEYQRYIGESFEPAKIDYSQHRKYRKMAEAR